MQKRWGTTRENIAFYSLRQPFKIQVPTKINVQNKTAKHTIFFLKCTVLLSFKMVIKK